MWKPPKQPYAFEVSSGATFAPAGLWDAWKDREGKWLQSFAIVTSEEMEMSEANPKVGNIRNNGPEIMRAAAEAAEEGDLPL